MSFCRVWYLTCAYCSPRGSIASRKSLIWSPPRWLPHLSRRGSQVSRLQRMTTGPSPKLTPHSPDSTDPEHPVRTGCAGRLPDCCHARSRPDDVVNDQNRVAADLAWDAELIIEHLCKLVSFKLLR